MKDTDLHGSFQSSKGRGAQVSIRSGTVHGEIHRKKNSACGVFDGGDIVVRLGSDQLATRGRLSYPGTTSPQAPLSRSDQACSRSNGALAAPK